MPRLGAKRISVGWNALPKPFCPAVTRAPGNPFAGLMALRSIFDCRLYFSVRGVNSRVVSPTFTVRPFIASYRSRNASDPSERRKYEGSVSRVSSAKYGVPSRNVASASPVSTMPGRLVIPSLKLNSPAGYCGQ